MFDIGWQELLVIAIVLIVVVGPKDLPRMLRAFGKATARMRTMAGEFRAQFDEALREADLDDVRKTISDAQNLNPAKSLRDAMNPLRQVGDEIRAGLDEAIRPSSLTAPTTEDAEALPPCARTSPLPEPQAVAAPEAAAPAKRKAASRRAAAKSGGARAAAGGRAKAANSRAGPAASRSAAGKKAAAVPVEPEASGPAKAAGTSAGSKPGNGAARGYSDERQGAGERQGDDGCRFQDHRQTARGGAKRQA